MKPTKVEILRESIAKIVPLLSGRGVEVTQVGTKAYVSYHPKTFVPERVNIPYIPDNAPDALLIAIQGFVDHECAHILFSNAKFVETAKHSKVGSIYGVIEDTFIERKMKEAYGGSKENLVKTWSFVEEHILKEPLAKAVASGSKEAIFGTLLVPLMRFWSGQKECEALIKPHLPTIEPMIRAIGSDLIDRIRTVNSSEDGYKLAVAMHNRLEELKRRVEEEERKKKEKEEGERGEGEDTSGGTPDADGDSSGPTRRSKSSASDSGDSGDPDDGPGDESEDEYPEDGHPEEDSADDSDYEDDSDEDESEGGSDEEDSEGGSDEDDSDKDDSGEDSDEDSEDEGEDSDEDSEDEGEDEDSEEGLDGEIAESIADVIKAIKEAKDLDAMMDKKIAEEIEKAHAASRYTPLTKDLDDISEFRPRAGMAKQLTQMAAMEAAVSSHIGPLQRHLERFVAARSHSRMIPGYRSGRINPSALHRIATGDERLFRRKYVSRTKDVAVSLVVDLSGSMSGSKVDLAMKAAFALSSSLDRLNITHEIIGFTTNWPSKVGVYLAEVGADRHKYSRSEAVYMPIFKSFNSRFNSERRRAMACYDEIDLANNIDGESVEYAAKRLWARREARKLMIVLSDGLPCAEGDRSAQDWHLAETVKRIQSGGIEVFGIGIMSNAVKRYYRNHVVITKLDELPTTVMRQLEVMLLDPTKAA